MIYIIDTFVPTLLARKYNMSYLLPETGSLIPEKFSTKLHVRRVKLVPVFSYRSFGVDFW